MKGITVVTKRGRPFQQNHIENCCHSDTISSNFGVLGKKMATLPNTRADKNCFCNKKYSSIQESRWTLPWLY